MLAAGIVAGILLSPAALGRLAPDHHRQWFGGADPAVIEAELKAFRDETTRILESYEGTGVTRVAVEEYLAQRNAEQAELEDRLRRDIKADGLIRIVPMTTAVMLALLAVMVLEPLLAPSSSPDHEGNSGSQAGSTISGKSIVTPAFERLITVRYALAAVWLSLVLAQPTVLWSLPSLFLALLLIVALGVGLIPLGPTRRGAG